MTKRGVVIGILSLLCLLGRVFITPRLALPTIEGTYEALAHLLVGFLIIVRFYDPTEIIGPTRIYGWIGWGLTAWEAGWFLVQKFSK